MTDVSDNRPRPERDAEADAASEELSKDLEAARDRMDSWLTLFGLRRKSEPRSWEDEA